MPGRRTFRKIWQHLRKKWTWIKSANDMISTESWRGMHLYPVDNEDRIGIKCLLQNSFDVSVEEALIDYLKINSTMKIHYTFEPQSAQQISLESPNTSSLIDATISPRSHDIHIPPPVTASSDYHETFKHAKCGGPLEDSLLLALEYSNPEPSYDTTNYQPLISSTFVTAPQSHTEESLLNLLCTTLGDEDSVEPSVAGTKNATRDIGESNKRKFSDLINEQTIKLVSLSPIVDYQSNEPIKSSPIHLKRKVIIPSVAIIKNEMRLNPRSLRRIRPTVVALPHYHSTYVNLMEKLAELRNE